MKEYKTNYGYKVSVMIERDEENDEAKVLVLAPFYTNKKYHLPVTYRSKDISDAAILKDHDFIRQMTNRYSEHY